VRRSAASTRWPPLAVAASTRAEKAPLVAWRAATLRSSQSRAGEMGRSCAVRPNSKAAASLANPEGAQVW
jgi:hypothetical protein